MSRLTPTRMRRFHAVMTLGWAAVIPPAILLWRDSVPFLVAISVYANLAGHFAAWQGSRAEESNGSDQ